MNFFQPSYWFTTQSPEVTGMLGTLVFILFVLCFVLGIVGRIVTDRKEQDRFRREIGGRISDLLITSGLLGFILFFFSFENVQFFGARFWYPVWMIMVAVWAYYIVRYMRRDVPAMKARSASRAAAGTYLPTSKKRRKKKKRR